MTEKGTPKYYFLMEEIKQDILTGKYKSGDRLPSENQLSKNYQISRHTVRKALAMLINEGYIIAEHGKGTYCSERIRYTGQSKNIAVITTYITDYIFPNLIQGIDNVLTENGYSIILKSTNNSRVREGKCLEDILTKDIDGLIIEPSKSEIYCRHPHFYEKLDNYGIPYVFIQGIYPQMLDKPNVRMNDYQGGYELTKYLIYLGHQHIAGIFKVDDIQGKERHKGYVKALQEAGRPYNPDMVLWFHTEDRTILPVSWVANRIKQKISLDAIVCYNDQIAVEIMKSLAALHIKVPEDISITGYDNSFIAQSELTKLTTIAHPQKELGELAATLLLDLIKGKKEIKTQYLMEPQLIKRTSCKKRND
jgi:Transcriptional regulators